MSLEKELGNQALAPGAVFSERYLISRIPLINEVAISGIIKCTSVVPPSQSHCDGLASSSHVPTRST